MIPCRHARRGHRAMVVARVARPWLEDGAVRSHKGYSVNCQNRSREHRLALAGQWFRGWEGDGNVGGKRETAGMGQASPDEPAGGVSEPGPSRLCSGPFLKNLPQLA
jgi:hypothetical protein